MMIGFELRFPNQQHKRNGMTCRLESIFLFSRVSLRYDSSDCQIKRDLIQPHANNDLGWYKESRVPEHGSFHWL